MFAFKVSDMFSIRSIGAIVKSVKALDSEAIVRVDMVQSWVEIDSGFAHEWELGQAIRRAGFNAEPASYPATDRSPDRDVDIPLPIDRRKAARRTA